MNDEEKNVNEEKQNGKIKQGLLAINELKKTPRGRSFLFFGVYLVLFILIFAGLNGGTSAPRDFDRMPNDHRETDTEFNFDFRGLRNQNYEFIFTYQFGEYEAIFEGRRDGNRSEFTKTTTEITNYIKRNNRYFITLGEEQTEVVNPFYYNEFLDVDLLIEIIEQAIYVSRTEYAGGNVNYRFNITTEELNYLIDGVEEEVDEGSINSIEIIVNNWGEVQKIILDLSNYAYYRDGAISATINFSFSNFGDVDFTRVEEEEDDIDEYDN